MTTSIRNIFEHNSKLLGEIDKVIYYFREQEYKEALGRIAISIDGIRMIIEAIIQDREYFNLVNTESLLEMLNGIVDAKLNQDFILLADLLELQLINFLVGVQELIMSKEEIDFEERDYQENISLILGEAKEVAAILSEPINTAKLLQSGYRVEFTSCGCMTLATENNGLSFYFHTNINVQSEAFLLAKHWFGQDVSSYIIYGYGMGYHIKELHSMAPEAEIVVYEADPNVLQLACAFTDLKSLLSDGKVKLVYDPGFTLLTERISHLQATEVFQVHYPSYKNIRTENGKELVRGGLSWITTVEQWLSGE